MINRLVLFSFAMALPLAATFAGGGCILTIDPEGRDCTEDGRCADGYSCSNGQCVLGDGEPDDGGVAEPDAGSADGGANGDGDGDGDGGPADAGRGEPDAGFLDGGPHGDGGTNDEDGGIDAGVVDGGEADGGLNYTVPALASPAAITFNTAANILWSDSTYSACDIFVGENLVESDVAYPGGTEVKPPGGTLGDFAVDLVCDGPEGDAYGRADVIVDQNVIAVTNDDFTVELPRYQHVPGSVTLAADDTVSATVLISLVSVGAEIKTFGTQLTSLRAPLLETVGEIELTGTTLTATDLASLHTVSGGVIMDGTGLSALDLPALVSVNHFEILDNQALTSLDFSSLNNMTGEAVFLDNPLLPTCSIMEQLDGLVIPSGQVSGNLDEAGPCSNGWSCPTNTYGDDTGCSCGCGALDLACALDGAGDCVEDVCTTMQSPSVFDASQCVADLGLVANVSEGSIDFRGFTTVTWSATNADDCEVRAREQTILPNAGVSGTFDVYPFGVMGEDLNVEVRCSGAAGMEFASFGVDVDGDADYNCSAGDATAIARFTAIDGTLEFDETTCANATLELSTLTIVDRIRLDTGAAPNLAFPALVSVNHLDAGDIGSPNTTISAPLLNHIDDTFSYSSAFVMDFPQLETIEYLDAIADGLNLPALVGVGEASLRSTVTLPSLETAGFLTVIDASVSVPLLHTIWDNLYVSEGGIDAPSLTSAYNVNLYAPTSAVLSQLSTISGALSVEEISGIEFPVLSTVGESVFLNGSVVGEFPMLEGVGEDLTMTEGSIGVANPFPSLTDVGVRLYVDRMSFGSLAFPAFVSANDGIVISENDGAGPIDFGALENTGSGDLIVNDNTALSGMTVGPLYRGRVNNGGNVTFSNNPSLPQCDIADIEATLLGQGFTGNFLTDNSGPLCE